jgi:hypothetical protein
VKPFAIESVQRVSAALKSTASPLQEPWTKKYPHQKPEEVMQMVKMLTCLAVIAMASASASTALAADTNPNPNCTHGERDCSANYPTSDVTKQNAAPNAQQNAENPNPNCTHGEKDCSANYPTTNVTKQPAPSK